MRGPQTATVVGPSGEEIFTDEYARVKVQFHWDREGKKEAGARRPLRAIGGDAEEIRSLAAAHRLKVEDLGNRPDLLGRDQVRWQTLMIGRAPG